MGRTWLYSMVAALAAAIPGLAAAQDCVGDQYTVAQGETLFSIAEKKFGDPEKWTLIYYSNQNLLKDRVFQVLPGDVLTMPCEEGDEASVQAAATPLVKDDAQLRLLTGSGRMPFADENWVGQGMVTELVHAAMEATPNPVTYSITFENDWSQHLFPLLDEKSFDMGYPWFKPNCDEYPNEGRCANFHFSEPVVEVIVLLWVKEGSKLKFESDEELFGKTICRPNGHFTHDLETKDRQWLSRGLVNLEYRKGFSGCYEALLAGEVDAVSANVFNGAHMVDQMGLRGQVVPLDRPISVQGMHLIISKRHWAGTTLMYRFNAGLAALKGSDRYAEIVTKHLGLFWDQFKS